MFDTVGFRFSGATSGFQELRNDALFRSRSSVTMLIVVVGDTVATLQFDRPLESHQPRKTIN